MQFLKKDFLKGWYSLDYALPPFDYLQMLRWLENVWELEPFDVQQIVRLGGEQTAVTLAQIMAGNGYLSGCDALQEPCGALSMEGRSSYLDTQVRLVLDSAQSFFRLQAPASGFHKVGRSRFADYAQWLERYAFTQADAAEDGRNGLWI